MNTTYTYIQTHKSLYENQVLSCGSSSRGADKPNTKYVAGRKGNRSNQPTCALLSRNCFKLVISHSSTTALSILLVKGMGDERSQKPKLSVHKTGARWAEAIQDFPIRFRAPLHQSRLTMPWKNQQEVHSLKPMQLVDVSCQ